MKPLPVMAATPGLPFLRSRHSLAVILSPLYCSAYSTLSGCRVEAEALPPQAAPVLAACFSSSVFFPLRFFLLFSLSFAVLARQLLSFYPSPPFLPSAVFGSSCNLKPFMPSEPRISFATCFRQPIAAHPLYIPSTCSSTPALQPVAKLVNRLL